MRLIMLGALLAAAISLAGLLSLTGTLRQLATPDLSAEVHLSSYPLPTGFGIEPQEVADFLVAELISRATDDIALRLALGEDGQQKLIEIGIPRLVNSVVVRDMITQIKPLANVLSVANFRLSGQIAVTNKGAARQDVALTVPGLVQVEAASGTAEIQVTESGLTALRLGDMAAGETRVMTVWLGQAALDAGAGLDKAILLGDASGEVGRVWFFGTAKWSGSDLQAMPVARWLISGAQVVVFVASVLVLIVAVLTRFRMGRRSAQRRVSRA